MSIMDLAYVLLVHCQILILEPQLQLVRIFSPWRELLLSSSNLSQIDFVDSSGLGALVQLAKLAQSAGTLQIVTNARVTQTVKLVRLEQFLSLRPSVAVALENTKQA